MLISHPLATERRSSVSGSWTIPICHSDHRYQENDNDVSRSLRKSIVDHSDCGGLGLMPPSRLSSCGCSRKHAFSKIDVKNESGRVLFPRFATPALIFFHDGQSRGLSSPIRLRRLCSRLGSNGGVPLLPLMSIPRG